MAGSVSACWLLALSAWLVLSVRAECGRECARCLYALGQQAVSGSGTCTLECGGIVEPRKLELCRDALAEEDRMAIDSVKPEGEDTQHLLVKKYGGFMKRYGGFMIKKAAELDGAVPAEGDGPGAAEKKYGGFMKKDEAEGTSEERQLDLLREILRVGLSTGPVSEQREGDVAKRYGGFMRSLGSSNGEEEEEEAGRDLHKRYGGFMLRVGRPQWLDEPKGYGINKRWQDAGETAPPEMQKRYGGFMD